MGSLCSITPRRSLAIAAALIALSTPVQAESPEGALLICGGGPMPPSIYQRFHELAGGNGAKLVVIPTASGREPSIESITQGWRARGYDSITVLHTRDRTAASEPAFAAPLRDADAVWISGGAQKRLASAYGEGPVERELKSLVSRGGVVAGTSAGAAIQSRVMIVRGNPEPEMGRGFGLVEGVIIDQHFLARNRFNRLLTALRLRPDKIGIGIDESTAIELRGDTAKVLGDSAVVVVTPPSESHPLRVATYTTNDRFKLTAASLANE